MNIEISIAHQKKRMAAQFKSEIAQIDAHKNNCEAMSKTIIEYVFNPLGGVSNVLPYYYILCGEYNVAWILLYYLNIGFAYNISEYHPLAKLELESPNVWDIKPIGYHKGRFGEWEHEFLLREHGKTCFRINANLNTSRIEESMKEEGFDVSPGARYKTFDRIKNFPLTYDSFYITSRMLEIYFRQEKIDETEECLFRLRHIASLGKSPGERFPGLTNRLVVLWVNMYDCWYQARHESDPERRKILAWMALYWFLDLGLFLIGSSQIEGFVHFPDGCEIIGEFDLMGEDQENFIKHLKRLTAHASISFCKKVMDNPINILPFKERNMPDYDTFQRMVKEQLGLY